MENINITKHNIGDFISKEMEGSASSLELLAIKEWIKESTENEQFYNEIKKVDEMFESSFSEKIDIQKGWGKVKDQISIDKSFQSKRYFSIREMIGYAAAIGVLIFGALSLFQQEADLPNLLTTNAGLTHELKDGSQIHLAENTALSKISEDDRIFAFSGRAEFEVVHDDAHPFQVNMDDVRVKDLGTVFNIDAMPGNDTVFVSVDEGLVQFFTLSHAGIFLKQGEEGMYIKSKNKFYKRSIDIANPLLNISFQNSTLGDVIDYLSYSFRKRVEIENDEVKNCNITVDFSDATYVVVKEIIEETLNVQISEKGEGLVVSGTGCD